MEKQELSVPRGHAARQGRSEGAEGRHRAAAAVGTERARPEPRALPTLWPHVQRDSSGTTHSQVQGFRDQARKETPWLSVALICLFQLLAPDLATCGMYVNNIRILALQESPNKPLPGSGFEARLGTAAQMT